MVFLRYAESRSMALTAPLIEVVCTNRGEPAIARENSRRTLVFGWPHAGAGPGSNHPLRRRGSEGSLTTPPSRLSGIGAAVGPAYNGDHDGTHDTCPLPLHPAGTRYIRRELDMFFGTLPSVAEGFQLRTWRGGPLAGQPKVPPPVRTMVERGLVEIRIDTRMPKAYFSAAGLTALRLLALDRRYMDPQKFAHVRAELGLEAPIEGPVSDT